jgi:hypothetical protein
MFSVRCALREGINALDAANLAYSSISNLRQQIKPAERVHGIIVNGGLAPNGRQRSSRPLPLDSSRRLTKSFLPSAVIPDFTSMQYYIRSPTAKGVKDLRARVLKCFECVINLLSRSESHSPSGRRSSRLTRVSYLFLISSQSGGSSNGTLPYPCRERVPNPLPQLTELVFTGLHA